MRSCRHRKDLIQFFERQSFSLRQAKVAEYPTENIPCSVPAKCTLWFEGTDERWPGEGQDEVETPSRSSCESLASIRAGLRQREMRSLPCRNLGCKVAGYCLSEFWWTKKAGCWGTYKCFGRVCKRHRAFSRTVYYGDISDLIHSRAH